MRIEINLPGGIDCWALRYAGVEVEGWTDLMLAVIAERAKLPATLKCKCLLSDSPAKISATVLSFGENEQIDRWIDKSGRIVIKRGKRPRTATRVRIEINNEKLGKTIRRRLQHYCLENDGEGRSWREHCELYAQIRKTLKREGLSYEKIEGGECLLTRRAIQVLMELCRHTDPFRRSEIRGLFADRAVAKPDRAFVAEWLIQEFKSDCRIDDQLGMSLWSMAVPEIADDLIGLIEDRGYGDERWPLCLALAKTRHRKAAEVIASILGQGLNTRGALEALGKLPARKYVKKIRKYLRDPDADVRREAKRTLKKLGFPVDRPPPLRHLVKNLRSLPAGFEEWSTNLDLEDLVPTLNQLYRCVEKGFGKTEVAEIAAVADEMKADQTRAFRFPVTADGKKTWVWVVIFMDDIDSPDLELHSTPGIIRKLNQLTS